MTKNSNQGGGPALKPVSVGNLWRSESDADIWEKKELISMDRVAL